MSQEVIYVGGQAVVLPRPEAVPEVTDSGRPFDTGPALPEFTLDSPATGPSDIGYEQLFTNTAPGESGYQAVSQEGTRLPTRPSEVTHRVPILPSERTQRLPTRPSEVTQTVPVRPSERTRVFAQRPSAPAPSQPLPPGARPEQAQIYFDAPYSVVGGPVDPSVYGPVPGDFKSAIQSPGLSGDPRMIQVHEDDDETDLRDSRMLGSTADAFPDLRAFQGLGAAASPPPWNYGNLGRPAWPGDPVTGTWTLDQLKAKARANHVNAIGYGWAPAADGPVFFPWMTAALVGADDLNLVPIIAWWQYMLSGGDVKKVDGVATRSLMLKLYRLAIAKLAVPEDKTLGVRLGQTFVWTPNRGALMNRYFSPVEQRKSRYYNNQTQPVAMVNMWAILPPRSFPTAGAFPQFAFKNNDYSSTGIYTQRLEAAKPAASLPQYAKDQFALLKKYGRYWDLNPETGERPPVHEKFVKRRGGRGGGGYTRTMERDPVPRWFSDGTETERAKVLAEFKTNYPKAVVKMKAAAKAPAAPAPVPATSSEPKFKASASPASGRWTSFPMWGIKIRILGKSPGGRWKNTAASFNGFVTGMIATPPTVLVKVIEGTNFAKFVAQGKFASGKAVRLWKRAARVHPGFTEARWEARLTAVQAAARKAAPKTKAGAIAATKAQVGAHRVAAEKVVAAKTENLQQAEQALQQAQASGDPAATQQAQAQVQQAQAEVQQAQQAVQAIASTEQNLASAQQSAEVVESSRSREGGATQEDREQAQRDMEMFLGRTAPRQEGNALQNAIDHTLDQLKQTAPEAAVDTAAAAGEAAARAAAGAEGAEPGAEGAEPGVEPELGPDGQPKKKSNLLWLGVAALAGYWLLKPKGKGGKDKGSKGAPVVVVTPPVAKA